MRFKLSSSWDFVMFSSCLFSKKKRQVETKILLYISETAIHVYIYMYFCMYACTYACMHVFMHICMYIGVYKIE